MWCGYYDPDSPVEWRPSDDATMRAEMPEPITEEEG